MTSPSASDTSPAPSPDSEEPSTLRRWGRRVLWGLGGLLGTVVLLVGLALLVLQTETGATAAIQFLAPRVNPMTNTTLSVEQASGNWVRSLRLTNVSLTRPDSASGEPVTMAQLDTLAVRYRLGALLQGRLHLTSVALSDPSVTMRQTADSTWDWVRRLPLQSETPDTSAGMPIRIDRLGVDDGQFSAVFHAEERDSTARVRDLELTAQDLQLAPSVEGRLDTLGLQAHPPGDTMDLRMTARGVLSSRRLRIDTLRLTSPRSQVYGHGEAHLPLGPNDSLDDVSLSLRATPLVLGDLKTLIPTLAVDPQEAIELRARLTGSGRRLALTTDARVRDGGTLTARIEATPRTESPPGTAPLHYRIDAQARDLTTSLIGTPDSTQTSITATVEGALRGPALDSLDGTLDAQVTDTRLYGLRASSLTLQSTVRDGTADVNLQGAMNGATLSVDGTARPFDALPSADLAARIQNLPLTTVAPDAPVTGTISTTAQVKAQSMGSEAATYNVDAALLDSRIGRQQIDSGQLSVALRPETLSVEGTLRLPRGRVLASGSATFDGTERFTLDTGRLEGVNVAALVGDTTDSGVTATVRAQGRGFDPQTMQAQATLTVQDAHYGPYRMDTLNTEVRLNSGQLAAKTDAQFEGGEWTLSATGRPFAAVPSVELTQGRFRNVNIGPILQDTTLSSALHGTVQGRVEGTSSDTLQFDASITIDTSRINRQKILGASLDATMRNGTLQSSFSLDTPTGAAQLTMAARPFDDTPSYRIPEGTFENLNVGALAGVSGLTTDLSGELSLAAQRADLSRLTLDSELTFEPSTINRATLSEGRLSVTADRGRVKTSGQLAVAGGSVQLRGHADSLASTPQYMLRTSAREIDVSALAGLDSLQTTLHAAQGTVEGRGADLDSLTASTRFSADSVRVGQVRIHTVNLAGMLENGLLQVDTLTARSNVGTVQGEGPLGLTQNAGASKFDVQLTMTDAAPLRRLIGASTLQLRKAVVEAHVYGSAGEQRFDGSLEVNGLLYNDMRLSALTGLFSGARGDTQLLGRLEVEAQAGYFSALGLTAAKTRLQSHYDGTTVELWTDVELDPTHTASLTTSFQPTAEPLTLQLREFNARMGPDRWSLLQETSISVGDMYRVDDLRLESGSQRITIDGMIDFNGSQNFRAALKEVRLEGFAPLFGLSGLGGTATGTANLTGPATNPSFDGRLHLALQSQEKDVGTLRLDVGYDSLTVALDARLTHQDGSVLTLTGSVPADFRLRTPTPVSVSDRPVRLAASTEAFPINWIDPFLDPASIRSVTGTLTADAAIRGTRAEPDLSGAISVSDLGAFLPPLATRYRNGTARLELNDNKLRLTESQIHSSNDGSLSITGLINFPKLTVGEYDLTIEASEFFAIDTQAYREGVIGGQMSLRGTIRQPALSGNVRVLSGSVYYTEALAGTGGSISTVSLNQQAQLILEKRFGIRLTEADTTTFDTYEALSLDLNVEIQRDTWLRSNGTPELNVQITGDLDVQKDRGETNPRVLGTINVVGERSTLQQFGQQFEITEGSLTFNGDPYSPYLTITAVYEQQARSVQGPEVRITLELSGRFDDLSFTLSSDPQMDTRNILSYLATGRPANAIFSGESEGGGLATQVALGQATNFFENVAASELNLDVVRLEVQPEGISYLTVGRYLTPRFFASIQQPVFTTSTEASVQSATFVPDVTLEYQLTDYMMLRSRTNQQSLQLNLLFEYAY